MEKEVSQGWRAKLALQTGELEFRHLLDKLPAGVYTCDPEGLITYFNRRAVQLWGRAPQLNDPVDRFCGSFKLYSTDGSPIAHDQCWMALALKMDKEYNGQGIIIERPDGQRLTVLAYANPIRDDSGKLLGAVNVLLEVSDQKRTQDELRQTHDELEIGVQKRTKELVKANNELQAEIAERKRTEEELRQSEERFRLLVLGVKDYAIFMLDTDGRIISWNAGAERIKEYKAQEIIGRHFSIFYTAEDIEHGKPQHCLDMAVAEGRCEDEGWRLRKDGSKFWANIVITALRDKNQNLRGFSKVTRDVTEKKQVEEELKRVNHQMELILNAAGEGICGLDVDGNITFINPSGAKLIGCKAEEIIGRPMHDVMHHSKANGIHYQLEECPIHKSLLKGDTYHIDNEVFWRKDGTSFPVEYISTPIQRGNKAVSTVITFNDITARDKMEKERLQFSKLESVGILAGGIAHDFNNFLSALFSTITVTKLDVRKGTNLHNNLTEAERICLQARGLTQQLLAFSRGGSPIKQLCSIAETITATALFTLRGSNVRCEFSIEDGLWDAEADQAQIVQIINNLVINAQQAMPQGGLIKIRANNTQLEAGFISSHIKRGKYVNITIEDQGIGIPKEHLTRIFDPYFTTKQKGSGLGLATTYSIIRNHDGFIDVESQVAVGTKFYIYIPASDRRIEKKVLEKEAVPRGRGRVLIMDDMEIIRKSTGMVLRRMGYEVDYASNGLEAVEIYKVAKESNKPFDLAIMDLTVPGGMGGKEAIKKLTDIDPKVRAIVSSAYANDPIMSDYREHGFRGVISKPYSMEELTETLRKVMNEE
jgi:PAS domain S-box-containing protein